MGLFTWPSTIRTWAWTDFFFPPCEFRLFRDWISGSQACTSWHTNLMSKNCLERFSANAGRSSFQMWPENLRYFVAKEYKELNSSNAEFQELSSKVFFYLKKKQQTNKKTHRNNKLRLIEWKEKAAAATISLKHVARILSELPASSPELV